MVLAAFVGLRKGELLGLRRGDVDLDLCEITIVQQRQLDRHGNHLVGPPKTDAGRRTLAIPAALVDDIRAHLAAYAQPGADGYVLAGAKGGPLAPHVLHEAWVIARTEVGLPGLHFHDLRHEATSRLFERGYDIPEVAQFTLHESWTTLKRYTHLRPEQVEERPAKAAP